LVSQYRRDGLVIAQAVADAAAQTSGRPLAAGFFGMTLGLTIMTFVARFVPEKSQRLRRPPPRLLTRHNNACLLVELAALLAFGLMMAFT
jgi:hypothetical protein